jgi:lysophospholipase L1-like esterase
MKFTAIMLAFTLAATLIAGAFPLRSVAAGEALIGDIDRDGEITVSDSLLTMRAAAGLAEYSAGDLPVYDVTGDGEVGAGDAVGIMRCSLGMPGGFGYDGVEVTYAPNTVAKKHGVTQAIFDNTLVSAGNTARLARVMERAAKGDTVNVVTLGGSITYGLYASTSQKCWAYLTYKWWTENFPKAKVNYHNVGISGTSSILGVHRMGDDVIAKDPDLVIVEFSVNDTMEDYPYYEGIVRNVLTKCPDAAVIMFFTVCESGWTMQNTEIPIGNHYGVPMISGANAVNGLLASHAMIWTDFGTDDAHPTDKGHEIYASLIRSYLDSVKKKYTKLSKVVPAVPEALYGERYKDAKLYMGGTLEPDSLGVWTVNKNYQTSHFNHLKGAWLTTKKGKALTFTVTCKEINLLYMRWKTDPNAGRIDVKVDGVLVATVDGNFNDGWGDHLYYETVYKTDEEAEHVVTFTGSGGNFTLAGIMLS